MFIGNVFLVFVFLFGSVVLSGLNSAILKLGRIQAKEEFKKYPKLFFFQHIINAAFSKKQWEGLFFSISFSKHVLHLAYALFAIVIFFTSKQPVFEGGLKLVGTHIEKSELYPSEVSILLAGIIIVSVSLITDMIAKLFASSTPQASFKFFAPFASFFLIFFFPVTAIFSKILRRRLNEKMASTDYSISIKDKILEVLYESELADHLDPHDRKLILSVASFKERIAREIMVPRIDVLSLSYMTSVKEAFQVFLSERYSRIPIYQESVDHIIGVLLYKDVVAAYSSGEDESKNTVKNLIKPVLYTPETKKISQLLQEFRTKQIHLAIVVDEYGGTEGIVTIEDILEELVGEISDEYDIDDEVLYVPSATGGWTIDARMSILDVEKELGLKIPQSPEYDTIGGYIIYRAGYIPSKGWLIHHDDFDLEILSAAERSIEKISISPHKSIEDQ